MERRCRVCTSIEDEKQFRNLFDGRRSFAEKLFYVTSISVFEMSNIQPALICNRCADDLGRAYRIKKVALESDEYFKTIESLEDIEVLADIIDGSQILKPINSKPTQPRKKEKEKVENDPEYSMEEIIDFDLNDVKIEILDEYRHEQPEIKLQPKLPRIRSRTRTKTAKIKNEAKGTGTPRGPYLPRGVERIIRCNFEGCTSTFPKPSALKYHLQIHSNERNHHCDVCGMQFKTRSVMTKHRKKHLDIRLTCDKCGQTYREKAGLITHLHRVHLGIRIVCHLCGKGVSSPGLLKIHMLYSHGGEKSFKCGICDKAFFTKGRLKQHIDGVHGERPWVCEICSRNFSKRYKLGEHMKQVHKITLVAPKRFVCTICGSSFDKNKLLQHHLTEKHQVILEDEIDS